MGYTVPFSSVQSLSSSFTQTNYSIHWLCLPSDIIHSFTHSHTFLLRQSSGNSLRLHPQNLNPNLHPLPPAVHLVISPSYYAMHMMLSIAGWPCPSFHMIDSISTHPTTDISIYGDGKSCFFLNDYTHAVHTLNPVRS